MSQLQNDLSAAEKLPREPRDTMTTDANMAEWKQRVTILDAVQQLEQLTVEEKESLVQLIRANADQVNALLAQSGTVDEFHEKLVSLARSNAHAVGEGTNDAPMNPGNEEPAAPAPSPVLDAALHKIFAGSKKQVATASVEHIAKLISALKKKPSDKKNRVHNTSNIIIKKHIVGVPGAEDFFCVLGFKKTHESAKEVFTIAEADVNLTLLDSALDAIATMLGEKEEQKAAAGPAKRVICAAGCGFWGEEKTEDMCSVCYKKKYFGAAAIQGVGNPKEPTKCIRQCGFWGADKFGGMCSVCFHKEHPEGLPKPQVKNWRKRLVIVQIKIRAMRRFQEAGQRRKQPNRKVCYVKACKRKLGITGIECKCGFVFCGQHRYAYAHDCTYDYKGAHQKVLNAQNPSLRRDKAPGS